MAFVTKSQLKAHLNLTSEDIEFDPQLPRYIAAAQGKVVSFLNRNVYEELPAEPLATDIVINEEIRLAILDIAGYYFDARGNVDEDMVFSLLGAYIGHLRIFHGIGPE